MVAAAQRLEDLGCDFVIHHIGYDERRGIAARGPAHAQPAGSTAESGGGGQRARAGRGRTELEQAVRTPEYGAPLVVLGAPLTIDADAFKTATGDLESSLRLICEKVHSYGDVAVGKNAVGKQKS